MRQFFAVGLVLGGVLIGACVPNPFTPKATNAADSVRWEYREIVITTAINSNVEKMNEEGGNEWELVSVDGGRAYFKRPKP